MLKARVWIIDDGDPNINEVYEHFDMLPTHKWEEGTFQNRSKIMNFHLSLLN